MQREASVLPGPGHVAEVIDERLVVVFGLAIGGQDEGAVRQRVEQQFEPQAEAGFALHRSQAGLVAQRPLQIPLLVERRFIPGTIIQFRATVPQHSASDREVAAIGVDHEIHRVEMAVLEIHAVHVVIGRRRRRCGRYGPRCSPSCTCRRAAGSSRGSRRAGRRGRAVRRRGGSRPSPHGRSGSWRMPTSLCPSPTTSAIRARSRSRSAMRRASRRPGAPSPAPGPSSRGRSLTLRSRKRRRLARIDSPSPRPSPGGEGWAIGHQADLAMISSAMLRGTGS